MPTETRPISHAACRYELVIHRSYQEMAEHYGTVIIPARIKKPRDKSKVETGLQIAEPEGIPDSLRDRHSSHRRRR